MGNELRESQRQFQEAQASRKTPDALGTLSTASVVDAAATGEPEGARLHDEQIPEVQAQHDETPHSDHQDMSEAGHDAGDHDRTAVAEPLEHKGGQEQLGRSAAAEESRTDSSALGVDAHDGATDNEDTSADTGESSADEPTTDTEPRASEEGQAHRRPEPSKLYLVKSEIATKKPDTVPEAHDEVPDEHDTSADDELATVTRLWSSPSPGVNEHRGGDDGGDSRTPEDKPHQQALAQEIGHFTDDESLGRPLTAGEEGIFATEVEEVLSDTSLAATPKQPGGPEVGRIAETAVIVDGHRVSMQAITIGAQHAELIGRLAEEGVHSSIARLSLNIASPLSLQEAVRRNVAAGVEVMASILNSGQTEWSMVATPAGMRYQARTRSILAEMGLDDIHFSGTQDARDFVLPEPRAENVAQRLTDFIRKHMVSPDS